MSALRVLPWALHVALEYLAGIFLVVSPFVLAYTDSTALPVQVVAGVVVLATAVLSRGAMGVYAFLPVWVQALLDYVTAFALMVAPFAFGYRDEADALLVSVMTGLGLLVMSLLSRYPQPKPAPAPAPATTEATEEHPREEHARTELEARHPEADPDLPVWVRGADGGADGEAGKDRPDQTATPRDEAEPDHRHRRG